jgi:hypothetical protein
MTNVSNILAFVKYLVSVAYLCPVAGSLARLPSEIRDPPER